MEVIAADVPARPHLLCGCLECATADSAKLAPTPDWPLDPVNGRLLCTPERPMPNNAAGRWSHSDARVVRSGDYSDSYRCASCGATWTAELPE